MTIFFSFFSFSWERNLRRQLALGRQRRAEVARSAKNSQMCVEPFWEPPKFGKQPEESSHQLKINTLQCTLIGILAFLVPNPETMSKFDDRHSCFHTCYVCWSNKTYRKTEFFDFLWPNLILHYCKVFCGLITSVETNYACQSMVPLKIASVGGYFAFWKY